MLNSSLFLENFESSTSSIGADNMTGSEKQTILSEEEILGPAINIIYLMVHLIQGGLAFTGNLLTILIVFRYEELRDSCTHLMIASLALADMVAGFVPYLSLAGRFLSESPSVWISLCYLELFMRFSSIMGNLYSMLIVTVDRYVYLTRPLRYEQFFTPFNGLIAICITWLFSISQPLVILVFWTTIDVDLPCRLVSIAEITALVILQPAVVSIFVILPAYIRIGLLVRKLKKTEPHLSLFAPEAQPAQRKKLKERRMAKTMGLVLGVYLGAWSSVMMGTILLGRLYKPPYPFGILLLNRIFVIIYWMQSVLNPFLYGGRNKTFAKYYRKILGLKPSDLGELGGGGGGGGRGGAGGGAGAGAGAAGAAGGAGGARGAAAAG